MARYSEKKASSTSMRPGNLFLTFSNFFHPCMSFARKCIAGQNLPNGDSWAVSTIGVTSAPSSHGNDGKASMFDSKSSLASINKNCTVRQVLAVGFLLEIASAKSTHCFLLSKLMHLDGRAVFGTGVINLLRKLNGNASTGTCSRMKNTQNPNDTQFALWVLQYNMSKTFRTLLLTQLKVIAVALCQANNIFMVWWNTRCCRSIAIDLDVRRDVWEGRTDAPNAAKEWWPCLEQTLQYIAVN